MLVTSERAAREESVMQGHSAMLRDWSHRRLCSLLSVRPLQHDTCQKGAVTISTKLCRSHLDAST